MSILVLGATGNTGSQVVEQLRTQGADFAVMTRSADKAEALGLAGARVRSGDYNDPVSLKNAMQGVERIYVAMPPSPDNRSWTENLVEAAKAAGVRHIVKLSGFGAHAGAGSEIVRTHYATDELIRQSGLAYTILQPNSFFQNLYGSLATIKEYGKFFLPLGDAAQSVIDVRDVAAVAVAALTGHGHENRIYKLSGPRALTFHEMASILSSATGKSIEYVPVSQEQAAESLKQAGMPDWVAEKLAEILAWFGNGEYAEVTGTVAEVLGKPPRRFEDFAVEFAQAV